MKKNFLIFLFFLCYKINAQTYLLTVNNGYGSGSFKAGDTVHVWAKEFPANSVFDKWTGDVKQIEMQNEWHSLVVMPPLNVNITANFKTIPTYQIKSENIQGKIISKPVYSYFPTNNIGVIYFFHGTGGKASNWFNSLEYKQMINKAISDSFAIIVTEADEATTGIDANSDGKLRWLTYPLDSNSNVDMANIKIITDTFIKRGLMTRKTKRYSIGMSNGGAYSASCSYLFNFNAGISYCAQGLVNVFAVSKVPFQFCMAKFDMNENVGATGNANAKANAKQLNDRGICNKYYLHDKSPLYPERIMRISGVTLTQSQNVLNELKSKGYVNSKNFITELPDTIIARYLSNPTSFPAISALNGLQRVDFPSQLKSCFADHQFYSDYNSLSLNFLKNPGVSKPSNVSLPFFNINLFVFPNPFSESIQVQSNSKINSYCLLNAQGQIIFKGNTILGKDFTCLDKGIYFLNIETSNGMVSKKIVKK